MILINRKPEIPLSTPKKAHPPISIGITIYLGRRVFILQPISLFHFYATSMKNAILLLCLTIPSFGSYSAVQQGGSYTVPTSSISIKSYIGSCSTSACLQASIYKHFGLGNEPQSIGCEAIEYTDDVENGRSEKTRKQTCCTTTCIFNFGHIGGFQLVKLINSQWHKTNHHYILQKVLKI